MRNPTWPWGSAQDGAAGGGTVTVNRSTGPALHPSPGLILAAIVVVLATQVVRLFFPGRGPYALTLLLSVAGLVGGEMVAGTGHLAAPTLGVIHPLADVALMTGLQGVGVLATVPAGRAR